MNESCLLFAEENGAHIVRHNLCRNFLLHLVSMHDFNLVTTLTIERAMARLRLLKSRPGQRDGAGLRQEDDEEEEEDWETAEESQPDPDPDPDMSEDRAGSEGTSSGCSEKKDQSQEGSAAADTEQETPGLD